MGSKVQSSLSSGTRNESPDAVFHRLQIVALHTTGEVLRELTIPTICMLPPADGPLIKWLRMAIPDRYASASFAPCFPSPGTWGESQSFTHLFPSPVVVKTDLGSVTVAHSASGESDASLITIGATLSEKLRCRLRRGEALVPDTLNALRFKYGLSPKPAVWPDGAPIQVLTQLHWLLDEDDAIQGLYAAAIQAETKIPYLGHMRPCGRTRR
jgi:hypothetical protein